MNFNYHLIHVNAFHNDSHKSHRKVVSSSYRLSQSHTTIQRMDGHDALLRRRRLLRPVSFRVAEDSAAYGNHVPYLSWIGHRRRGLVFHLDAGYGFAGKWGGGTCRISGPSDFRSGILARCAHLEAWRVSFTSSHRIPHASLTRFGRTIG